MAVERDSLSDKLARIRAAKKAGRLEAYLASATIRTSTSSQTANSWGPMMRV